MRRLVMLVLALAAVAIAVTACGSEANDYRGDVKKVQDKYLADLEKYRTRCRRRWPPIRPRRARSSTSCPRP